MSAHASQAFSIAHCTDSEDLPSTETVHTPEMPGLRLNSCKTQAIWLGHKNQIDRINIRSIPVLSLSVSVVDSVCDLGVVIRDGPKFGRRRSSAEGFGRMFGSVRLGNMRLFGRSSAEVRSNFSQHSASLWLRINGVLRSPLALIKVNTLTISY